MNIICMIGVSPSLIIAYKYNSIHSLCLFIIGILNHYHNSKNIYLKNIDRFFCLSLGIYGSYYFNKTGKIFNYIPILFFINYILYINNYINKLSSNIFHVLFIQWPSLYSIYKTIIKNKL